MDVGADAYPEHCGRYAREPSPCPAMLVRGASGRTVSVSDVPALAFDEAHDDDGLVLPLPPPEVQRTLAANKTSVKTVAKSRWVRRLASPPRNKFDFCTCQIRTVVPVPLVSWGDDARTLEQWNPRTLDNLRCQHSAQHEQKNHYRASIVTAIAEPSPSAESLKKLKVQKSICDNLHVSRIAKTCSNF